MKRLILCFLVCFSQTSLAWGPVGHSASAEIADQLISAEARAKAMQALDGASLADVANWPDSIKQFPEWGFARWYHFEKIADGSNLLESLRIRASKQRELGDTVMAILQAQETFRSPQATQEEKQAALKFIVHLIADLHQPLHTGRPEDNGGNKIPKTWNGRDTTLHSVWDSGILLEGHSDLWQGDFSNQSGKTYAAFLMSKFRKSPPPNVGSDDIEQWLKESMDLRLEAYAHKDEGESEYTQRFIDEVDKRIYLGGARLARVIERLMKQEPLPQAQVQLKKAVERIVGPLDQIIQFKPKPGENIDEPDPCDEHDHEDKIGA